jgi:hypothetical protein
MLFACVMPDAKETISPPEGDEANPSPQTKDLRERAKTLQEQVIELAETLDRVRQNLKEAADASER